MSEEKSLAEVPVEEVEDESIDVTNLPEPEDFDFGEFVAGVRPTRRAVVLYQRNDIRADLDLLDDKIEMMRKSGEDTSEQEEIREGVAAELLGSGRMVIVEARSSDWIAAFYKKMRDQGLDLNSKALNPDKKPPKDRAEELAKKKLALAHKLARLQLVEQIVHPSKGVTLEALEKLAENSEKEIDKLFGALNAANGQAGVTPDFSLRPYGRQETPTGSEPSGRRTSGTGRS